MLPGQPFACLGLAAPRACGFLLSSFLSSVQPLVSFRTVEMGSALLWVEDSHGKGCCYDGSHGVQHTHTVHTEVSELWR